VCGMSWPRMISSPVGRFKLAQVPGFENLSREHVEQVPGPSDQDPAAVSRHETAADGEVKAELKTIVGSLEAL